jgi:hypothetical protein
LFGFLFVLLSLVGCSAILTLYFVSGEDSGASHEEGRNEDGEVTNCHDQEN